MPRLHGRCADKKNPADTHPPGQRSLIIGPLIDDGLRLTLLFAKSGPKITNFFRNLRFGSFFPRNGLLDRLFLSLHSCPQRRQPLNDDRFRPGRGAPANA
jgi:hypothetical protein